MELQSLVGPNCSGLSGYRLTHHLNHEQVREIYGHIVLLKRARAESVKAPVVDVALSNTILASGALLVLIVLLQFALDLRHFNAQPVGQVLGPVALCCFAVFVIGVLARLLISSGRITTDGPLHDYKTVAHRIPFEIQFVNTVSNYESSAVQFVGAQTAWLSKRHARVNGAVLRNIGLPALLAVLASMFGVGRTFAPQLAVLSLIGCGVFVLFWLFRFNDVEHQERYEALLSQAAELAKSREELSAVP